MLIKSRILIGSYNLFQNSEKAQWETVKMNMSDEGTSLEGKGLSILLDSPEEKEELKDGEAEEMIGMTGTFKSKIKFLVWHNLI